MRSYVLRAGIEGHPSLCGRWQFGTAGKQRATFHIVGSTPCWLHLRGQQAPIALYPGDLMVFPHDAWHLISSHGELRGESNQLNTEGDGPLASFICGYFEFLAGQRNPILEALPELILIRETDAHPNLRAIGSMLLNEAQQAELGTRTVLDKLADTLFVMVLRHYMAQQRACSAPAGGLLAALGDARLRRALAAIHEKPSEPWTLEALAQRASMSRAAFAQRFTEQVGTSAMDYLRRWRMTQAELLLGNPRLSVASVAEQLGYSNEVAFRKAFKRVHGQGPGSVRQRIRRGCETAECA